MAVPQTLPPRVFHPLPAQDGTLEEAREPVTSRLSFPPSPFRVPGSSYCLEPVGWNTPSLFPSQAIITCAFPVLFPACRGKVESGGKVRC